MSETIVEERPSELRPWEFSALLIESVLFSGLLMAIVWTIAVRSRLMPESVAFFLGLVALGIVLIPIESVLLRQRYKRRMAIRSSVLWMVLGAAVGAGVYMLMR
jgi:NAD/NADP transhydrogenase beta subunit